MAIFVAIFLSVLLQEPYLIDSFQFDNSQARIKMENVVNYDLNFDEVQSITRAENILRYQDRDEARKVQMLVKKDGFIYSLEGERGQLVGDIVTFYANVIVNRSDGAVYESESLIYDVKKSLLYSKAFFTLASEELDIRGDSFEYDFKTKKIRASGVFAKFEMEEI